MDDDQIVLNDVGSIAKEKTDELNDGGICNAGGVNAPLEDIPGCGIGIEGLEWCVAGSPVQNHPSSSLSTDLRIRIRRLSETENESNQLDLNDDTESERISMTACASDMFMKVVKRKRPAESHCDCEAKIKISKVESAIEDVGECCIESTTTALEHEGVEKVIKKLKKKKAISTTTEKTNEKILKGSTVKKIRNGNDRILVKQAMRKKILGGLTKPGREIMKKTDETGVKKQPAEVKKIVKKHTADDVNKVKRCYTKSKDIVKKGKPSEKDAFIVRSEKSKRIVKTSKMDIEKTFNKNLDKVIANDASGVGQASKEWSAKTLKKNPDKVIAKDASGVGQASKELSAKTLKKNPDKVIAKDASGVGQASKELSAKTLKKNREKVVAKQADGAGKLSKRLSEKTLKKIPDKVVTKETNSVEKASKEYPENAGKLYKKSMMEGIKKKPAIAENVIKKWKRSEGAQTVKSSQGSRIVKKSTVDAEISPKKKPKKAVINEGKKPPKKRPEEVVDVAVAEAEKKKKKKKKLAVANEEDIVKAMEDETGKDKHSTNKEAVIKNKASAVVKLIKKRVLQPEILRKRACMCEKKVKKREMGENVSEAKVAKAKKVAKTENRARYEATEADAIENETSAKMEEENVVKKKSTTAEKVPKAKKRVLEGEKVGEKKAVEGAITVMGKEGRTKAVVKTKMTVTYSESRRQEGEKSNLMKREKTEGLKGVKRKATETNDVISRKAKRTEIEFRSCLPKNPKKVKKTNLTVVRQKKCQSLEVRLTPLKKHGEESPAEVGIPFKQNQLELANTRMNIFDKCQTEMKAGRKSETVEDAIESGSMSLQRDGIHLQRQEGEPVPVQSEVKNVALESSLLERQSVSQYVDKSEMKLFDSTCLKQELVKEAQEALILDPIVTETNIHVEDHVVNESLKNSMRYVHRNLVIGTICSLLPIDMSSTCVNSAESLDANSQVFENTFGSIVPADQNSQLHDSPIKTEDEATPETGNHLSDEEVCAFVQQKADESKTLDEPHKSDAMSNHSSTGKQSRIHDINDSVMPTGETALSAENPYCRPITPIVPLSQNPKNLDGLAAIFSVGVGSPSKKVCPSQKLTRLDDITGKLWKRKLGATGLADLSKGMGTIAAGRRNESDAIASELNAVVDTSASVFRDHNYARKQSTDGEAAVQKHKCREKTEALFKATETSEHCNITDSVCLTSEGELNADVESKRLATVAADHVNSHTTAATDSISSLSEDDLNSVLPFDGVRTVPEEQAGVFVSLQNVTDVPEVQHKVTEHASSFSGSSEKHLLAVTDSRSGETMSVEQVHAVTDIHNGTSTTETELKLVAPGDSTTAMSRNGLNDGLHSHIATSMSEEHMNVFSHSKNVTELQEKELKTVTHFQNVTAMPEQLNVVSHSKNVTELHEKDLKTVTHSQNVTGMPEQLNVVSHSKNVTELQEKELMIVTHSQNVAAMPEQLNLVSHSKNVTELQEKELKTVTYSQNVTAMPEQLNVVSHSKNVTELQEKELKTVTHSQNVNAMSEKQVDVVSLSQSVIGLPELLNTVAQSRNVTIKPEEASNAVASSQSLAKLPKEQFTAVAPTQSVMMLPEEYLYAYAQPTHLMLVPDENYHSEQQLCYDLLTPVEFFPSLAPHSGFPVMLQGDGCTGLCKEVCWSIEQSQVGSSNMLNDALMPGGVCYAVPQSQVANASVLQLENDALRDVCHNVARAGINSLLHLQNDMFFPPNEVCYTVAPSQDVNSNVLPENSHDKVCYIVESSMYNRETVTDENVNCYQAQDAAFSPEEVCYFGRTSEEKNEVTENENVNHFQAQNDEILSEEVCHLGESSEERREIVKDENVNYFQAQNDEILSEEVCYLGESFDEKREIVKDENVNNCQAQNEEILSEEVCYLGESFDEKREIVKDENVNNCQAQNDEILSEEVCYLGESSEERREIVNDENVNHFQAQNDECMSEKVFYIIESSDDEGETTEDEKVKRLQSQNDAFLSEDVCYLIDSSDGEREMANDNVELLPLQNDGFLPEEVHCINSEFNDDLLMSQDYCYTFVPTHDTEVFNVESGVSTQLQQHVMMPKEDSCCSVGAFEDETKASEGHFEQSQSAENILNCGKDVILQSQDLTEGYAEIEPQKSNNSDFSAANGVDDFCGIMPHGTVSLPTVISIGAVEHEEDKTAVVPNCINVQEVVCSTVLPCEDVLDMLDIGNCVEVESASIEIIPECLGEGVIGKPSQDTFARPLKRKLLKRKCKSLVTAKENPKDVAQKVKRRSTLGLRVTPSRVKPFQFDHRGVVMKTGEKPCETTSNDSGDILSKLLQNLVKSEPKKMTNPRRRRHLVGQTKSDVGELSGNKPSPPVALQLGELVWARLSFQRFWPAVLVDPLSCGQSTTKPGYCWVFWFGDYKVSEVPLVKVRPFAENFSEMYGKSGRKTYETGILEALKELGDRVHGTECGTSKSNKELIVWASSSLSKTSQGHKDLPLRLPSWVLEKLEKIRLAQLELQDSDTEAKVSRKNESNATKGTPELLTNGLEIQSVSDICIACCRVLVGVNGYVHPFFEGGLCPACREAMQQSIFLFDSDGTNSYCIICGFGKEVFVCEVVGCNKVYCSDCVRRLAGEGIIETVRKTDGWSCFLCSAYDPKKHGLLHGKREWRTNLASLFHDSKVDVFPIRAAEDRQPIRVLSLFDGIGTGKLVLDQLSIQIEKYVASEVEQDAITVAQVRHPRRIDHIGDVRNIRIHSLEELGPFDLLIGGSPCNELSVANPNRKGLEAGSGLLFFDFLRILMILKDLNRDRPLFWIYENVASMNEESRSTISRMFGCEPALWDAQHFSAQRRARYFWGNIPGMYCPLQYSASDAGGSLDDHLFPTRKAKVQKIRTITTQRNSLLMDRNKDDSFPVTMGDADDSLWIPEVERIFGFPEHYTDVANLSASRRLKLLGQSWSVPVIRHLLSPLGNYFQTTSNAVAGANNATTTSVCNAANASAVDTASDRI